MDIISGKDTSHRPLSSSSDWSVDFHDVDEDTVSVCLKPKPKDIYPAKSHARSVAKKLGVERGLIYLEGLAPSNYEDSDQPVYFRQRRYFYYLSGVDFEGFIVTYNIRTDHLKAWIPSQNSGSSVIFNGSNPSRKHVEEHFDFDKVHHITSLDGYLTKFIHNEPDSKIFVLHNNQAPTMTLRRLEMENGKSHFFRPSPIDSSMLKPAMDAARVIKSPYELKLIRKANEITTKAHINVLRGIKYLENEAEIEAIFTATCIAEKAKKQSYNIIAGSGVNASTLHYGANNEPLEGRQLVCLDAGSEWKCYASDVTRTFPISGEYTPEAKAIYDIVAQMQEECIAMVKPKANFRDIHMHAHKVAINGLLKLGLLHNGTFDELYSSGASVAFFPHGLGHYLGLEVHDFGDGGNLLFAFQKRPSDWAAAFSELLSNPRPPAASILAPNMVITVEPGIYFSKYALEEIYLKSPQHAQYINKDLLAKYYPVGGVRIEDDVLVTEDGYENLTTTPKGDDALKIINERDEKTATEMQKRRGWFW